jgi:hypothetical protein
MRRWRSKSGRFGRGTGFDMLIKIAVLFLVVMAGLALASRFRIGGPKSGVSRRVISKVCAGCGRPRIGPGSCPCGRP